MRAQVLTKSGGPENFQLTDLPIPEVRKGTVLVRIAATSVNPIDIKIREGLPVSPDLPGVLGCDVAGTVEKIGSGVIGFAAGDKVFGCVGGVKGQGGALAAYIVADAQLLSPKPRNISMREAATLPLVSITAWDGLERTSVGSSDYVLIHGGTGGVGHVAIQLAKSLGAMVATTISSAESATIARKLGADETIDWHAEKVEDYVQRLTEGRGFDVVFDPLGGDNLQQSFRAVGAEGRVVTTNARTTQDLGLMHSKGLSLYVVFMILPLLRRIGRDRHGRIMRNVSKLVEEGKLHPLLDPTHFTLETAPDAHRLLESGKARGKVAIDINEEARAC